MRYLIACFTIICTLSACSMPGTRYINITDAKIVTAIDEKLMPIQITDKFPATTSKVVCWFQWKDAKVNTKIIAKWHYTTDDIHILDYAFAIPKKSGAGSVTLSAPEGKTLPVGQYKVELTAENYPIKSLTFKIE